MTELSRKFKNISAELTLARDLMVFVKGITDLKTKAFPCMLMDKKGYCTIYFLDTKYEGFDMKPVVYRGKTVYLVNVLKHPFCVICPHYAPKRPSPQTTTQTKT